MPVSTDFMYVAISSMQIGFVDNIATYSCYEMNFK